MMKRVNMYFFGVETTKGWDLDDLVVYYGTPAVAVAGLLFAILV